MASSEFHAHQEAMVSRPAPPPPASLAEYRQRIDQAMGAVPLADGVAAVDVDAGGVPAIECRPEAAGEDSPVIVYFHGGGFRIASALAYRAFGSRLASASGARVLVVDYRLAPENPFPAAVDDAEAAYRWVLSQDTPPNRVVVAGDSAGGGLAASVALRTLRNGPVPAGVMCVSPWVDLTVTAGTYDSRADVDKLFSRDAANEARDLYLHGHDPTDPIASPVFGDWAGGPPMLILVGDAEVLLDDSRRLAEVAAGAGIDASLQVFAEMPHVWLTSYPAFPEAVAGVDAMVEFIHRRTGAPQ